jgi:hypothetical protein
MKLLMPYEDRCEKCLHMEYQGIEPYDFLYCITETVFTVSNNSYNISTLHYVELV